MPGAHRYLDEEEEEVVVRWHEGCASIGYAKSVREVRSIVGAIVAAMNNLENVVVSHGWWDRFRARHPNLTLRTGESLAYHRAVSTNRVVIDKYFDFLEEVLVSNNLCSAPHLIFNADETDIQETVRTTGLTIYPTTFSTIIVFTHSIHQRAPER